MLGRTEHTQADNGQGRQPLKPEAGFLVWSPFATSVKQ
jgi:hypothetical protein